MKWKRQTNIDAFIADFLCPEHRSIVEVNGGIHESQYSASTDFFAQLLRSVKNRVLLRHHRAGVLEVDPAEVVEQAEIGKEY